MINYQTLQDIYNQPPKRVAESIVIQKPDEKIYIDITTNGINTPLNPSITGSNNNFRFQTNIDLRADRDYTVQVVSISYVNPANLPAGVQLLLLTDISDPIIINSSNSSVIFKSNKPTTGTASLIVLDDSNNSILVRNLTRKPISSISFQVVRSDNGQPFVFDNPNDIVTVMLLIQNK